MAIKYILIATGFLTRIPVPKRFKAPSAQALARSMAVFPLVGLLLGGLLVLLNSGLSLFFPNEVANLLLLLTYIILTGGLHLDGLADTIDALSSGKEREGMLAIMKDSRIGSMGVIAVVTIILLKLLTLTALSASLKIKALLLMPTLGRWAFVPAAYHAKTAAREDGIGRIFVGGINKPTYIASSILTCCITGFIYSFKGILLLIITFFLVRIATIFFNKKIGGQTGDTFGAIGEIVEAATLVGILLLN